MCGIAAIAGTNLNIERYKTGAMLQKLKYRGPDGEGELNFPHCWLGHRRLAIIDLDSGTQPMTDGKLAISFNGEIYNYRELRDQFEQEGLRFKTHSDTEVILKAYRKWGDECPKYLDGMFAFIIWDNENDKLFVARDRLGKKPLYYFFDDSSVLFASEIKSLIASGALKPKLDFKAIDNYLRLMYIPSWKSIYKNVHQIPPAYCGTFKNGKLSLKRYWKLTHKPIQISYEEAKTKVHELLKKAIKKRLIASDVEVGAFLSGGIDSTLVALIAAKEFGHPLKMFSVSYGGHDEFPFSKKVCDKINCEHFVTHINEYLPDELKKIIAYFDEPHADTSDFPQHLVSNLASKKVKVVLSGDGADELFLGYKWHVESKENEDLFDRRLNSICAFSSKQRKRLWNSSKIIDTDILLKDTYDDSLLPIDKVVVFDLTSHLPGQILNKVDRAGMMHGLEVRSPFLDTELVEFVFNLPYEYKVRNEEQKYILKDILSEYMPADFVYRKKQGFGSPVDRWLHNPVMKTYIHEKLGSMAKIRSTFSSESIDEYLHDFYTNNFPHERAAQRIWVLLCLEHWMKQQKITC